MKDDDEQEENTFGVTRYPCMPSRVALQQMRNRLHLAFLGRKLMKWTALATGRELRKIAIELDSVIKGFAEEMRNAFILLARARYFCPNLNKIVLENIGQEAGVVVIPTTKIVSAVKIVQFEIAETGVPPYEHLGIEKGGQAILEAKKAWLELLKKLIMMMQLRSSFLMVEIANKNATKKSNVLSKIVVPRLNETSRYILSELEEIEREEVFRLKRVIQKKEFEKQMEELKRRGVLDDKGAPIKKDDQGPPPAPPPPPPPRKMEAKSPGGSKTIVSRPPETVNLLILNPRDEPGPMSVGSIFMPPFGVKNVPDIKEIEYITDEKQSEVVESTLQSTAGVSLEDKTKEVTIHEEQNVENTILNQPGRSLSSEIIKSEVKTESKSKTEDVMNANDAQETIFSETVFNDKKMLEPVRNLLIEMTKDHFEDSEENKNQIEKEILNVSGTHQLSTSVVSLHNGDLVLPLTDPGYIANNGKPEIENIGNKLNATVTPVSNISEDTKDIEAVPYMDSLMSSIDEKNENKNTGKESIRSDKNVSESGTTEEIIRHKLSKDNLVLEETTNPYLDEKRSDTKDKKEHDNSIHIRSISNVFTVDHIKGERNINTPAKILVSEVVKGIIPSKEEIQLKEGMKDAETSHEYSTSNNSTQYEDIEEEQDLKTASKHIGTGESKQFSDTGTSTRKSLNDKVQEDTKDDWEFVLANDKQGDDVDSKSIVMKNVDDISSRVSSNVSRDKLTKEGSVNKPLRIIDLETQRNIQSTSTIKEGDDSNKDINKETKTKKKKRKKDGNDGDDSNEDASTKENIDRSYIN